LLALSSLSSSLLLHPFLSRFACFLPICIFIFRSLGACCVWNSSLEFFFWEI
jgi:hypothetical protein